MSLSEDECLHVYRRLQKIALIHDLDWLVNEVEEHIGLGDTRSETVTLNIPTAGRAPEMLVSAPYSMRQRVEILIQAIERAVCDKHDIAVHVWRDMQARGIKELVFYSERDPDSSYRIGSSGELEDQRESTLELRVSLNRLRRMLQ